MFSSRRLAKRSIIGTRICSPWQDGRYYPGIIQSTETGSNGDDLYIIRFDDGYTKLSTDKDIVGPGFQNITVAKLKHGQKVYVTHSGREVTGLVLKHDPIPDEVLISIKFTDGAEMEVTRRLEDVRLMESRKSARLQDQDTDYSRLADVHPEPKKRTVSQIIDVPNPAAKPSRRRKSSPDGEESMDCDHKDELMDTMDEHMAAMVLTSLSCSPVSPQFPGSFTDKAPFPAILDKGAVSPGTGSGPGSSVGSSGVFMMKSEPSTPSPPQHLSTSAPAPLFGTPPIDEGIELDDTNDYFTDDFAPKKRRSTRTMFKCTWRDCGKVLNTINGIESHVRQEHLGPRDGSDSDMSDHEEEFYYTEVEVTVDNVTETFADMYTSSPPNHIEAARFIQDHDYQKKEPRSAPQNIPGRKNDSSGSHQGASFPIAFPSGFSQFSRSWQSAGSAQVSPPARITKTSPSAPSPAKSHLLSSSPKSSPMHKKSRSEVKKCRKVYGMENRDMWCTQCKWKKACSRFHE